MSGLVFDELPITICHECTESVAGEYGVDGDTARALLQVMGEDIEDHNCDRIETNGEIPCDCPGHSY